MNSTLRTLLPSTVLLAAGLWACSSTGPAFIPPDQGGEGDPASPSASSTTGDDGGAGVLGDNDAGASNTTADASAPDARSPAPSSDAAVDAHAPTSEAGVPVGPDAGACINAVPSPGSGKHNPGEHCLGCHDNQTPHFTVAGTLFAGAANNAAVSGATIEVTDATGKVVLLPTYTNGNFYTTTPLTFPLHVRGTKCPANLSMAATVAQGSCNISGCHAPGMRIHL